MLLAGCAKFTTTEKLPLAKVQTLAGANELRFGEVFGAAVDRDNRIFVSDGANNQIWRVDLNGATKLVTDKLNTPSQIAIDKDTALIVADTGSHTIKRVNLSDGAISIVAGIANQAGFRDGATDTALFRAPVGVAVGKNGEIFVADTYNDKIRVIKNNVVTTIAGTTRGLTDGANAKFDTPCGIAVLPDNQILIADAGNKRLRQIDANNVVSTFAGNENQSRFNTTFIEPVGVAVDENSTVYVADAGANQIKVFGRKFIGFWEILSGGRGAVDDKLNAAKFNRPTNVAVARDGDLLIADSSNKLLRVVEPENQNYGQTITAEIAKTLFKSKDQMRTAAAPRWPYNPPEAWRDVAGTFGELRGELKTPTDVGHFHNGLDVAGNYGETARFVRTEKVLRPLAAEDFNNPNNRERLRMPTLGYIHIRLGRDVNQTAFDDARFLFDRDQNGKLQNIRVPRGSQFQAGEAVGTLNPFNHVHLIAGETGAEMNALDALVLPDARDTVAPTIEKVTIFDENWRELKPDENLTGKTRIVVRAFDQMNGNNARRRLGVYALGYQIFDQNNRRVGGSENSTISFERLPDGETATNTIYAFGSKAGYTPETVFNYIVTNTLRDGATQESFFDAAGLPAGNYQIRVFARDFFGNETIKSVTVKK